MKIAFFGTKPYDKIWFKPMSEDYGYKIKFLEVGLNIETVSFAKNSDAVCAFVNDDLGAEVIDALRKMGIGLILLRCAGYNNVDLKKTKECDIKVLHVPGYSPKAVAEFSMGLLLVVNRQIHRAYNRTRDFNMNINGLMGTDLNNRIAGIIGTGKIGQAMISICEGFGMKVIAYDPYPDKRLNIEYVKLDELFAKSDVISLHCPLTPQTKYLINKRSLSKMKKGVYIINTSRGGLIKTEDLNEFLLEGKIGGVGLDVYEDEEGIFYEDCSNEIMKDSVLARLMTFPNVVVTSHQGYFTLDAMQAICIETMENAYAFENGLELKNEISL